MRFSRPFCLIRPDFKKKVYEDYEYYVYDNGNIVSTNFTTRKGKKVSCIYNLKTGVGKKTVQDKGIFIETKYEKRNVQETTLRTSAGYITKNFETGFTTIVSDKYGLDQTDRLLLTTIIEKFAGGPVGLDTLAAAVGEDAGTIEEVYEPYLIKNGFINRTPRGRVATELACRHLGFALPTSE